MTAQACVRIGSLRALHGMHCPKDVSDYANTHKSGKTPRGTIEKSWNIFVIAIFLRDV